MEKASITKKFLAELAELDSHQLPDAKWRAGRRLSADEEAYARRLESALLGMAAWPKPTTPPGTWQSLQRRILAGKQRADSNFWQRLQRVAQPYVWAPAVGCAAALALALSLQSPDAPALYVLRSGGFQQLAERTQWEVTAPGGKPRIVKVFNAFLTLQPGSVVELRPATILDGQRVDIWLRSGSMHYAGSPLPAGQAVRVWSHDVEIAVTGTRFELTNTDGRVAIKLDEGKVNWRRHAAPMTLRDFGAPTLPASAPAKLPAAFVAAGHAMESELAAPRGLSVAEKHELERRYRQTLAAVPLAAVLEDDFHAGESKRAALQSALPGASDETASASASDSPAEASSPTPSISVPVTPAIPYQAGERIIVRTKSNSRMTGRLISVTPDVIELDLGGGVYKIARDTVTSVKSAK